MPVKVKSKSKHDAGAATMPGGSNTSIPPLGKKPQVVEYEEEEFDTLSGIPIFDVHSADDDKYEMDFDEETLEKICENCNRRYEDTGDMSAVVDGHTGEGKDPEILAWAKNFRMSQIGKLNPRPCIACDFLVRKGKMARVKELPRRSVELWPDDMFIDPIALLGATTPARDLGLLFKKNNEVYKYRREFLSEENMNPEDLIKQCMEALGNMPEMAYLRELMSKSEAEAHADMEKEEVREDVNSDSIDETEEKPARLRMQRDQERIRYAKLESEYKLLFDKISTLERNERLAQRKSDLTQLVSEGFDFDLPEELDYVAELEAGRYQKHLEKIRMRYRKAPINVNVTPATVKAEGGVEPVVLTPDQVYEKAIKASRDKYSKR